MIETYSVASVTVATNAAHLLPRQLDALKKQSRKINEIIVVDNASKDGTVEMLATRYPEITVIKLPENLGVGGGYAEGLRLAALINKHRWTWLLDDDSVPPPIGLERLLGGLSYAGDGPPVGLLAPVSMDLKTCTSWPGLSWRGGRLVARPVDINEPLTFVDSVISSGSLLSTEAVEAAGLPRIDFFMDFVDHEYCLRLRRHDFRIAVVRDSVLEHEVGTLTSFNILGVKGTWADHPPWREYYIARNETFTMWHYYPRLVTKLHVVYRLSRHAFGILFLGRQKLASLRMQGRGFIDGVAGRLGKRYLPEK